MYFVFSICSRLSSAQQPAASINISDTASLTFSAPCVQPQSRFAPQPVVIFAILVRERGRLSRHTHSRITGSRRRAFIGRDSQSSVYGFCHLHRPAWYASIATWQTASSVRVSVVCLKSRRRLKFPRDARLLLPSARPSLR